MTMNVLFLTCKDTDEANRIVNKLLEERLIVCAKKSSVSSSFLWKGKIEKSDETLLIMDSVSENFDRINEEIKKLHSYEIFNLTSIIVDKTTKEVKDWIKEEL